jgi:hypothetical protein
MKAKLKPIKWYANIQGSSWKDNYPVFETSIMQPDINYRPVNVKYCKQKSRFIKR